MLNQLKIADCVGKTIAQVHHENNGENHLYLKFTDGSFVALRAEYEWEDLTIEDGYKVDNKDYDYIDSYHLIELGLITKEEAERRCQAQIERYKDQQRKQDEQTFEWLAKKLGKSI